MFIYSKTSEAFLKRIKLMAAEIIRNEMNLNIQKSRILFKGILYPLNYIVFEDQSRLGYFDSRTYELGISKKLMYLAKDEVIKNVLRHELAHFMSYLLFGNKVIHGEEFHNVCRGFGWNEEVFRAYTSIEAENNQIPINNENERTQKYLQKLKKLLALASSENKHESELATLKANQLLLEYNLDITKEIASNEEEVYVQRVLSSSRKSSKHLAIYEILKTNFVSPVFNHGRGVFYLEVIGDRTSVELADYVANFLDRELDTLWNKTKKENPQLKGIISKNSFFAGIAKGYVLKIEKQKVTLATGAELIVIEKNIQKNLRIVYPRIGHSTSSSTKRNENAHQLGHSAGEKLSIRPALQSGKSSNKLLTFSS